MSEPELPPDLAALERRLAARPRIEPPADLRARVLAASRDTLRHTATPVASSSEWHTWIAIAAAVLLLVNLSMSVAANTDWDFAPRPETRQATTDQLRALAPELPESELRRQALLARAGAELPPTVHLTPHPDLIRTVKEPD